ncbi:MAG TPA: MerR family transcriptional regulator [Acidimicrobiales bacterium]|nr:MerR family transcriptional regulator [Acidimicrobiales bacterium]
MTTTYRIAEVADRSGFTPAALRYYEEMGLVHPVGRTEAGYRLYDDASLQRLRFIARAKQLGCSLDEVADLSEAWDGGRCAHVQERLRATVEAKVAEAQRRIAELTVLTADLQRAAAGLTESPTGACDDTCGCVTEPAPAAATMQAVPLLARASATASPAAVTTSAGPAVDACGDEGCGCGTVAADDEPPVACTLDIGRMGSRVEEWAALLDAKQDMLSGVVARTPIDGGVRLRFGPGTDVAEVARLAAAEQDCCRFFRFTLSIDTDGITLEVRAPADAFDVVNALFGAAA